MEHASLYELLRRTAASRPDGIAYRYKDAGVWRDVRWSAHQTTVRTLARGLMALGVGKGDRVAILANTRLEWVQADFAILATGGVTTGIYASNPARECAWILDHSEAEVVLVEDQEQQDKVLSVRRRLPRLRHVVRMDGSGDPGPGVKAWGDLLASAREVGDEALDERAASVGPDDLAALVYTSGTTGNPKGSMLTHRNFLFSSRSAFEAMAVEPPFRTLLFLPLAHVFARLIVILCVHGRGTLAFAESVSHVMDNVREVRPHFIASVPRIYEKIYDGVMDRLEDAGRLRAALFRRALGVGHRVEALRQAGRPVPPWLRACHLVARRLGLDRVREVFGDELSWAVSGAAPLRPEIGEFFLACGVLVREGMGMTENSSFSNLNPPVGNKFGTVGPAGPGIEMKVADDGEILFRGPNVMKGYYKDPEATAEAIDEEGWLHTGDVGEIDEDGYLRVTDRKKDIIITAGGKNVAPQRVERVLRASRYIAQAVAVGDKRKFVSALVTLDPEHVRAWAKERGIPFDGVEDLASREEVRELIGEEIRRVNGRLASFETVKRFRILPRELTIAAGELTPTLKVKRAAVLEEYRELVEAMYSD